MRGRAAGGWCICGLSCNLQSGVYQGTWKRKRTGIPTRERSIDTQQCAPRRPPAAAAAARVLLPPFPGRYCATTLRSDRSSMTSSTMPQAAAWGASM